MVLLSLHARITNTHRVVIIFSPLILPTSETTEIQDTNEVTAEEAGATEVTVDLEDEEVLEVPLALFAVSTGSLWKTSPREYPGKT